MAAKLPTTPVAFSCLIFLTCRNNMVTTCRLQQSSIRQQYEELCAEGNIVASVPAGTGVMVMANTNVEIFDNDIRDHGTVSVLLVSYFTTGIEIKDQGYYPYAETIHLHGNTFGAVGGQPAGVFGQLIKAFVGDTIPDIVWDGVVNKEKMVDGKLAPEVGLSIHDNKKDGGGEVSFANLGRLAAFANPGSVEVTRDLSGYRQPFPPIDPVSIPGVQ
ncbi:MAG: hypothetical protein R3C56_30900 [Pirellulaceae bacterium]